MLYPEDCPVCSWLKETLLYSFGAYSEEYIFLLFSHFWKQSTLLGLWTLLATSSFQPLLWSSHNLWLRFSCIPLFKLRYSWYSNTSFNNCTWIYFYWRSLLVHIVSTIFLSTWKTPGQVIFIYLLLISPSS